MKHVILLHGALGCKSHWLHILPYLNQGYTYHNLNFPLHGGTAAAKKDLTLSDLTQFVSGYVKGQQLDNFVIMGYSMGGYVGLDLAIKHFKGLDKVITLGTKLNWDKTIAEEEISKLSLENLVPIHAKLEKEHGSHWQDVISATHSIMRSIGEQQLLMEDFKNIQIPVCLLLGERDKMVTHEETIMFSESGDTCSYQIIAGQPHLLERVDAELIAGKINALLETDRQHENS